MPKRNRHDPAACWLFGTIKLPNGDRLDLQAMAPAFPQECASLTSQESEALVELWEEFALKVQQRLVKPPSLYRH